MEKDQIKIDTVCAAFEEMDKRRTAKDAISTYKLLKDVGTEKTIQKDDIVASYTKPGKYYRVISITKDSLGDRDNNFIKMEAVNQNTDRWSKKKRMKEKNIFDVRRVKKLYEEKLVEKENFRTYDARKN